MLIRTGNRFELYPHKVKYTQNGETIEQWALPSKQWFVDFAEKWEHTEIIEFTKVKLTEEQVERFEEIKNMESGFESQYSDYILTGDTELEIPNTHPFNLLIMKKENKQLKEVIDVMLNGGGE